MFLCAYEDVIPIKFHKFSGIKEHTFKLRADRDTTTFSLEEGYPIKILMDRKWEKIYLPFTVFQSQIEALSILSNLDGESERQCRYINIHAAYEAVVTNRNVHFSSIRHALVHPVTKLTRPNVLQSLQERFNGLDIDLHNYKHQKEVYRCMAQMLIDIDKNIYETINENKT